MQGLCIAESIIGLVVEKIAGQLIQEAATLMPVFEHVDWIEAELRRMKCFFKDADTKRDYDERVKNWVADVRDVAYDAEDAIDIFILEMTHKRADAWFRRNLYCFNGLRARRKFRRKVIKIKEKLHAVTDSRSTYGIESVQREREGTSFGTSKLKERRRSFPHACEEEVVGLAEDIKMLETRVIHGEPQLTVISIVGMAGLGKTTLAKYIFNSSEVKMHFDCCAWVYISQEYKAKEILHDLGKRLMGRPKTELDRMDDEDLIFALSKFLEANRFLIVLDDIWKAHVWDDLKAAFPDRKNGSRILLTTRFKDVGLYADPKSPPHELNLLNEEDSWKLLCKKVSGKWNPKLSCLPPWSEELGRKIAKRCSGLPLAIIVMGGLLSRRDTTFDEWLKVLRSAHWQLTQEDPVQCADILALSYSDLPSYLKPCFLYFSLFPEDFEISARKLTLLWVAEGFVQPRGQEPVEDVAEDYLEELIGRSMVQVATRKSSGRIKTCRVHDLLRELSTSKAAEDHFLEAIHQDMKINSHTRSRRLAIHSSGVPRTARKAWKVRSLLCFNLNEPTLRSLKDFKLLRILDLEGVPLAHLNSDVGKLLHLRYLGLRETWLNKLPPSVCSLSNLQTLDLRSTLIEPIPNAVWKMQQLKHLYLNELREMVVSAPFGACLPNLQTLEGLCIGKTSCVENSIVNSMDLRDLRLHGRLMLKEEAIGMWIFELKSLRCLKLHGERTRMEDITIAAIPKVFSFSSHTHLYRMHLGGFMKEMPGMEDFPPNLMELSLQGCFLMEDPMKRLEKLPNLRILKLKQSSYIGKEMVCSHGGFPQLHYLKLSYLGSVQVWKIEEGAMGNLRRLEIFECLRLKIGPRGLWPVPTLRNLKLGLMPTNFKVKMEERRGENWYKTEHVLPT